MQAGEGAGGGSTVETEEFQLSLKGTNMVSEPWEMVDLKMSRAEFKAMCLKAFTQISKAKENGEHLAPEVVEDLVSFFEKGANLKDNYPTKAEIFAFSRWVVSRLDLDDRELPWTKNTENRN